MEALKRSLGISTIASSSSSPSTAASDVFRRQVNDATGAGRRHGSNVDADDDRSSTGMKTRWPKTTLKDSCGVESRGPIARLVTSQ